MKEEMCLIVLTVGVLQECMTIPCSSRQTHGVTSLATTGVRTPDSVETNASMLFNDTRFTVSCCGEITRWHVRHEGKGNVSLQVWRPIGPNHFQLLGENVFESTDDGTATNTRQVFFDKFRIQVDVGDVIGVKNIGSPIVRYDTCQTNACESSTVFLHYDVTVEEGDVFQWTNLQTSIPGMTSQRQYAFTADVDPKTPVRCKDAVVTVTDEEPAGSYIHTVEGRQIDVYHPDSSFSIVSVIPPANIAIDQNTGVLTNTARFEPDFPFSIYNVTVQVMDACTSQSGTCLIGVKVRARPREVILTNLPATTVVPRETRGPQVLYMVAVSRQRQGDILTCVIVTSSPPLDVQIFTILNISLTDFEISLAVEQGFDASDTDQYVLVVQCGNDHNIHNTSTLTIQLIPLTGSKSSFWLVAVLIGVITLLAIGILMVYIHQRKGVSRIAPETAFSIGSGNSSRRLLEQEIPSVSKSVKNGCVSPSLINVQPPWNYHGSKHVRISKYEHPRAYMTSHYDP